MLLLDEETLPVGYQDWRTMLALYWMGSILWDRLEGREGGRGLLYGVTEQCMYCNPARALLRVPAASTILAQLAWLQYRLCRHAHFNTVSLIG